MDGKFSERNNMRSCPFLHCFMCSTMVKYPPPANFTGFLVVLYALSCEWHSGQLVSSVMKCTSFNADHLNLSSSFFSLMSFSMMIFVMGHTSISMPIFFNMRCMSTSVSSVSRSL